MRTSAEEELLAIRDAARLEIAARIENQYIAGLPVKDGMRICAILAASGITQYKEPGTEREEVIDAFVADVRLRIEKLQAFRDRQRAADVEGCT